MTPLEKLKAAAQKHYAEPLRWTDLRDFGGSAYATVDHHVVSVMVDPPPGNAQIVRIRGGRQEPLAVAPQVEQPLFGMHRVVMEL